MEWARLHTKVGHTASSKIIGVVTLIHIRFTGEGFGSSIVVGIRGLMPINRMQEKGAGNNAS